MEEELGFQEWAEVLSDLAKGGAGLLGEETDLLWDGCAELFGEKDMSELMCCLLHSYLALPSTELSREEAGITTDQLNDALSANSDRFGNHPNWEETLPIKVNNLTAVTGSAKLPKAHKKETWIHRGWNPAKRLTWMGDGGRDISATSKVIQPLIYSHHQLDECIKKYQTDSDKVELEEVKREESDQKLLRCLPAVCSFLRMHDLIQCMLVCREWLNCIMQGSFMEGSAVMCGMDPTSIPLSCLSIDNQMTHRFWTVLCAKNESESHSLFRTSQLFYGNVSIIDIQVPLDSTENIRQNRSQSRQVNKSAHHSHAVSMSRLIKKVASRSIKEELAGSIPVTTAEVSPSALAMKAHTLSLKPTLEQKKDYDFSFLWNPIAIGQRGLALRIHIPDNRILSGSGTIIDSKNYSLRMIKSMFTPCLSKTFLGGRITEFVVDFDVSRINIRLPIAVDATEDVSPKTLQAYLSGWSDLSRISFWMNHFNNATDDGSEGASVLSHLNRVCFRNLLPHIPEQKSSLDTLKKRAGFVRVFTRFWKRIHDSELSELGLESDFNQHFRERHPRMNEKIAMLNHALKTALDTQVESGGLRRISLSYPTIHPCIHSLCSLNGSVLESLQICVDIPSVDWSACLAQCPNLKELSVSLTDWFRRNPEMDLIIEDERITRLAQSEGEDAPIGPPRLPVSFSGRSRSVINESGYPTLSSFDWDSWFEGLLLGDLCPSLCILNLDFTHLDVPQNIGECLNHIRLSEDPSTKSASSSSADPPRSTASALSPSFRFGIDPETIRYLSVITSLWTRFSDRVSDPSRVSMKHSHLISLSIKQPCFIPTDFWSMMGCVGGWIPSNMDPSSSMKPTLFPKLITLDYSIVNWDACLDRIKLKREKDQTSKLESQRRWRFARLRLTPLSHDIQFKNKLLNTDYLKDWNSQDTRVKMHRKSVGDCSDEVIIEMKKRFDLEFSEKDSDDLWDIPVQQMIDALSTKECMLEDFSLSDLCYGDRSMSFQSNGLCKVITHQNGLFSLPKFGNPSDEQVRNLLDIRGGIPDSSDDDSSDSDWGSD